jgi:hypothetical protein
MEIVIYKCRMKRVLHKFGRQPQNVNIKKSVKSFVGHNMYEQKNQQLS